jgi:hypothetical protein
MVLNFIKKFIYFWLLAYIAFLVTSIFFGGGIVKEIGEKFNNKFLAELADEGDAIKNKADSLMGRLAGVKEQREEKSARSR